MFPGPDWDWDWGLGLGWGCGGIRMIRTCVRALVRFAETCSGRIQAPRCQSCITCDLLTLLTC
uniref:Uncharacterized protein n=1 Tax=Anguilla anguilla TaxID=7936 RepID=A0A0E9VIV2_ANGAN